MSPEPATGGAQTPSRCGFVAVLGAPNAGKSTLINTLVGAKVSIVSPKVQTTRTRVLGIAVHDAAQLVFVDTPGIFRPRRRLERAMVRSAWDGAADADIVVLLHDAASKRLDQETLAITDKLKDLDRPAVLALNKIDRMRRESLLARAAELNERGRFQETFMISALNGDGVADLMDYLARTVPPGVWLFPEDQLSDMPQRLLAAEITREKLFIQLHQELPYALTVETESWEEFDDGSVRIGQIIFVERDSQKAIVLGKGGSRVKSVRTEAQTELADMLERKVHLFLQVKVRERWSDDPERYRAWNLPFDA
ncbi:MAG: GTPase Era [Alphaproteobacteria bacterium]|nr:GTPase Era [Alphaproteobacteria bacterium]